MFQLLLSVRASGLQYAIKSLSLSFDGNLSFKLIREQIGRINSFLKRAFKYFFVLPVVLISGFG